MKVGGKGKWLIVAQNSVLYAAVKKQLSLKVEHYFRVP